MEISLSRLLTSRLSAARNVCYVRGTKVTHEPFPEVEIVKRWMIIGVFVVLLPRS
jgi:hypothetical protein